MPVIVQKFGGTSVADTTRILRCARRALEAKQSGNDVIVVVSAMGHTTDELIDLAKQITDAPNPREMDMLMATGEQVSIALMAIALNSLGNNAVSMTGPQMGMLTNEIHTKARIQSINVDRIRKELSAGRIVVAAGFQGVTDDGQITTLGRGGSDTTAVAIAAALLTLGGGAGSVTCEIYTDVDGVYTADPRIVPNARKLARISYEEMLELANQGAAVMHNRAVLFGQKYDVPIHVRSSTKADLGTIVCKETSEMEDIVVAGCALKRDLGRISLRRIPNNPGVQGMVFDCIAKANIIVDDIIQTQHGDLASLSFTVDHNDLADVKIAAGKALDEIGTGELAVEIGLAKVSVAGVGMRTHSGVAAAMFRALGDAGINIANITTSDIKISCIVPKQDGERALKVVHDAFQLDKPQGNWANSPKAVETKPDTRKAVRST
ncbi:MAG: aspartate kinase [Phycisphaerales bacterium]|nr:aspartate kinase [Phycisphaerales bacterium]